MAVVVADAFTAGAGGVGPARRRDRVVGRLEDVQQRVADMALVVRVRVRIAVIGGRVVMRPRQVVVRLPVLGEFLHVITVTLHDVAVARQEIALGIRIAFIIVTEPVSRFVRRGGQDVRCEEVGRRDVVRRSVVKGDRPDHIRVRDHGVERRHPDIEDRVDRPQDRVAISWLDRQRVVVAPAKLRRIRARHDAAVARLDVFLRRRAALNDCTGQIAQEIAGADTGRIRDRAVDLEQLMVNVPVKQ